MGQKSTCCCRSGASGRPQEVTSVDVAASPRGGDLLPYRLRGGCWRQGSKEDPSPDVLSLDALSPVNARPILSGLPVEKRNCSPSGEPSAEFSELGLVIHKLPRPPDLVAVAVAVDETNVVEHLTGRDAFAVELDGTNDEDMIVGLQLDQKDKRTLLVTGILDSPWGLVHNWNLSHPDSQVRVGDRIVRVNDAEGSPAEMVRECRMKDGNRFVLLEVLRSGQDRVSRARCPLGHVLTLAASDDSGWGCDRGRIPGGCRSGITGFDQTEGMSRFRCAPCDYDLCEKCFMAGEAPP